MANAFRHMRGVVGAIRWHTYNAAAINGYRIARDERGDLIVRGTVVLADAFKMAQRPLTFVAPVRLGPPPHRDGEFRWLIESFTLTDGKLVARLGRQLEKPHAPMPFRGPEPGRPIEIVRR